MLFIDKEMYYRNVEEEITFYQKSSVLITNVRRIEEREKYLWKHFLMENQWLKV